MADANPDALTAQTSDALTAQTTTTINAPGRLNLIGEHIDHQNYTVLPCAINRYTTIHVYRHAQPTSKCQFNNVQSDIYTPIQIDLNKPIQINLQQHHWTHYILAALAELKSKRPNDFPSNGMDLMVSSNLPTAAGLSSSSALVVASMMAFAPHLSGHEIAELSTTAERRVGTAGGGMDQSVICLAKSQMALAIDFNPLQIHPKQIPSDLSLVLAYSGVKSLKATESHYNLRIFEISIGSYLLINHMGSGVFDITDQQFLLKLSRMGLKQISQELLHLTEVEILNVLEKSNGTFQHQYSYTELQQLVSNDYLQLLLQRVGEKVWQPDQIYFPFKRIRHVLTETLRVSSFLDELNHYSKLQQDSSHISTDIELIHNNLGQLLNQSHLSLKDNYECSCQELDELHRLAMQSGAYGAKLTGAGWGGYLIALVKKSNTSTFIDQMKKSHNILLEKGGSLNGDALFECRISGGATISVE